MHHKYISKSEMSFYTTFSCLEEKIFLMDPSTPSLLEGVNEVLHVDQHLERDGEDIL
jgi:hypothetical protein